MDARLPVRAFFTTRHGGTSDAPFDRLNVADHVGDSPVAVAANRLAVARRATVPVIFMRPEHGIVVAVLGSEYLDGREPPVADALVTDVPGLALATLAADCVPLLLHDGLTGAVAAVHVGRQGLVHGVVDAAIDVLVGLRGAGWIGGVLTASVGPAICGRCYEVPDQMRHEVTYAHPAAAATTARGTPALDLPRAVETGLLQRGFDSVVRSRRCTLEDPGLFSYRRDGRTGRQAGVVVCAGRE